MRACHSSGTSCRLHIQGQDSAALTQHTFGLCVACMPPLASLATIALPLAAYIEVWDAI